MFIGRKKELASLEKQYDKDSFQFAVIYGRRRVGKTTLINEFRKGKKSIYYTSVESTAKENLGILSAQILTALAPDAPRNPFGSFGDAFDYIFAYAKNERVIFAIDEYPYLAESDRAVSSILQAAIDKNQSDSKLFLLLCGSSMSFMENQVLGYKSPLYGRRTSQYKILPFNYFETAAMLSGFNETDKITLYGITGGIPDYISRIDNSLSLRDNVRDMFFDPSGRLFEEPSNLLKQELRTPQTYNGIITAIATGSSRLNEIATKTGIETGHCSNMLDTLISLAIVKKESPVTEQNSKRTIYLLEDQMFRFWYSFVMPEISRITAGLGDLACDGIFGMRLNTHIGYTFEECAKQYMWRELGGNALPVSFQRIGRWWGANRKERREEEIDFIAYAGESAIFGECKWRNEKTGADTLEDIIIKSELLTQFTDKYFYVFSKSGYTDQLINRAMQLTKVQLISIHDML